MGCNHYNECGCEVASCCFDCPLPVCKYEFTNGMQSVRGILKNLRIVHFLDEGRSMAWVMQVMDVSERTVYRAQKSKNTVIAPLTDTTVRSTIDVAAR